MEFPIMTLEEAAQLLRVSEDWLQRSDCPRIKRGNIVRYDRDTCLTWFRSWMTHGVAA